MTATLDSNSLADGRKCYDRGDYAQARKHLANCLRTGIGRGEACVLLGRMYLDEGNFSNAVKCLESAISDGQDSPDDLYLLCVGLFESKRYNEARLQLESVIEQHPGHWQAKLLLGKLFIEKDDLNAAESVLRKAVHIHEQEPELWYHLGLALYRNQRYDDAMPVLERAVRLEPDTVPQYHFLLGKTYLEQGRAENAITAFKQSAKIYPLAELYFPLARACQLAQRYDTAYQVYEKALDRPINKSVTHRILFHQAEILFEQGEEEDRSGRSHDLYLQAEQKLLRSLEFEPGFIAASHFLALVHIRTKAQECSAQELEDLLGLDDGTSPMVKELDGALEILSHRYLQRIHLGYALSLAGRFEEARNALEAALDDPEIQNEPVVKCRILRRLALVQMQMGDRRASCSTWRRLAAIDPEDIYGAARALAELETNEMISPDDRGHCPHQGIGSRMGSFLAAGSMAVDAMTFARNTLPDMTSPVELRNAIDRFVRSQKPSPPRWLSIGIGVNDCYINNVWYEPEPFLDGDLVKVEIGLEIGGKYVEVGETMIFGTGREEDVTLINGTAHALDEGIAKAQPGGLIIDITNAIEGGLLAFGLVPAPFGAGHAIRQDVDAMDKRTHPWIFNAKPAGQGRWIDGTILDDREIARSLNAPLEAGMCLALEPCALPRSDEAVQDARSVSDEEGAMQIRLPFWRSKSGTRIAKFVHTLLISEDGVRVLTRPSEGL